MKTTMAAPSRLAIRCVRTDLSKDQKRDERETTEVAARLGRAVHLITALTDPGRPWATVADALGRTHAAGVVVPSLEHVTGIEALVRERAQPITVVGEQVLRRVHLRAGVPA